MSKITSNNRQVSEDVSGRLRGKLIPLLGLLFVIAITVGIFYFYQQYPNKVDELKGYGYLGAFLISLTLNATVILPTGNVVILSALAAIMPSAITVGLAGGIGAAIGEITGYVAGYSGRAIVEKRKMYRQVEARVRRWGGIVIFLFALLPLVFDLAGIAAGVLRFPFWKFFLICWVGRTILYILVALAGAWGWEAVLPYLG